MAGKKGERAEPSEGQKIQRGKGGQEMIPRYSTRDHWIQESIKQIFNPGLFWAVRAAD